MVFNTSSYIIVWTNQRQVCQGTNLAPPTMTIHVCVIPCFNLYSTQPWIPKRPYLVSSSKRFKAEFTSKSHFHHLKKILSF